MKIYHIIFIALVLSFGCKGGSGSESAHTDTEEAIEYPIYLNLENITQMEGETLLSTVVSEITYIPLETNNNSLIRKVDRVAEWKNNFLVSDFFNLYLFDKTGKYLRRVSQSGNGPADFRYVNGIIPDSVTDALYLFTSYKFIKFDENVKFIESHSFEGYHSRILSTPDKNFLLYVPNQTRIFGDTTIVNSLIEIDTLGNVVREYRNNSPRYMDVNKVDITTGMIPFYIYNNQVHFQEFGNDTLFRIQDNTFMPYMILDLGKMKMDYSPEFPSNNMDDVNKVMERLKTKLMIVTAFESDHLFYLVLSWGMDKRVYATYNKKSKKVTFLDTNKLTNDIDGGVSFFPNQIEPTGEMIMYKSAEEFKEEVLSKDYNQQKAKYGERFEKVYQFANSLQEDDNPILIIAK
ncbi:6-bladed beta-propeller [Parabacteroides sp. OttesenSCG-928-G21]|nr:6-bladed beta-propeller [Parabacteroides sp. OttesenSCG-928-G21]